MTEEEQLCWFSFGSRACSLIAGHESKGVLVHECAHDGPVDAQMVGGMVRLRTYGDDDEPIGWTEWMPFTREAMHLN